MAGRIVERAHNIEWHLAVAERLSSGTGGAAESVNEAGDIQITGDFDTTTSAPPVVQQRHCSPLCGL
jgi:hypothetical protein